MCERIDSGVIPCAALYAAWSSRRRSVSLIVVAIEPVTWSAYMITSPLTLRRAPGRLDQRGARAQVAFLVRVEDRDEGDLGDVEALAQEIDADEDVELSE